MMAKKAKRFLLAAGLALLLPGAAGAAGFGPAEHSFWVAELFTRLWASWGEATGLWMNGGSIDPSGGGEGTNGGGSIDPNGGGTNGAGVCVRDCGAVIDPNG